MKSTDMWLITPEFLIQATTSVAQDFNVQQKVLPLHDGSFLLVFGTGNLSWKLKTTGRRVFISEHINAIV